MVKGITASFDRDVVVASGSQIRLEIENTNPNAAEPIESLAAEISLGNTLLLIQHLVDAYGETAGIDAREMRPLRAMKAEAERLRRERRREGGDRRRQRRRRAA